MGNTGEFGLNLLYPSKYPTRHDGKSDPRLNGKRKKKRQGSFPLT
jgi:hypothetical protein